MALAIFDLDETLIGGDSDYSWGQFLIAEGIVDQASYKKANDVFHRQYHEGTLNIHEFLLFCLKPLSQHSLEQLQVWHRQYMRCYIEPMLLPKAKECLAHHRDQGDFLLIITATNRFVTEPIAELLGVDFLIANEAEMIDGRYTGQPQGIPCFQEGKVRNLEKWLEGNDFSLEGSYFYSDSHNDLPLLSKVDNPVAVDPDDKLATYAKEAGWPIVSFR